ncbi:MAG TPA: hypothetical protein VF507_06370, partial [Pyrinomonadaceae bacterium]
AWYYHAHVVSSANPPYHFFGEGGIRVAGWKTYREILWLTFTSSLTPPVAVAMVVGVFLPARSGYAQLFRWWLVAVVAFVVLAGYGNRHQWYQLPLVPIGATLAAVALDHVSRKAAERLHPASRPVIVCAFFASLLCLSYLYIKPYYDDWAAPLLKAGVAVNSQAPRDAVIVVADQGDPTAIYYSRRKGWHFMQRDGMYWGDPASDDDAINGLEELRRGGARYLIFTQYTKWWLDYYAGFRAYLNARYRVARETDDYVIYELWEARAGPAYGSSSMRR